SAGSTQPLRVANSRHPRHSRSELAFVVAAGRVRVCEAGPQLRGWAAVGALRKLGAAKHVIDFSQAKRARDFSRGESMRISVIGCGYVGLVTGGCLAEVGHEVVCTDNDHGRIAMLEASGARLYQPHLAAGLAAARRGGTLTF